ncbi:pyruvate kinase [Blastopirellula retiformator]|uniref:Pyruvate kinase n=1 Tax=Blastopirellula retiformator TaxID=2527970 RepID=A0A5C5VQ91_9BACT|nr:pyruvate kinase [Blastopirellula retiformator]TWT39752.1 Pyruvate kinase [Blastopirellula retiformator]
MSAARLLPQRARTKIVATVGPACNTPEMLEQMMLAGVDVFRLNLAHGELTEHSRIVTTIREISERLKKPVAALADLSGPKIRLGTLVEDPIYCQEEQMFRFVRGDAASDPYELVCNYEPLIDEVKVGDDVMLADGTITMEVVEKTDDTLTCVVVAGGILRSRQGINLPGTKLGVETITPRDRDHVRWAAETDLDYVSLSFVREADDIRQLRDLLQAHESRAMVIAKIEKREALENLEEIVEVSNGVMVARGDLGVEIDVAEVAAAQKRIVKTCTRIGRPVIVATQMLDSMTKNSRPTRAEATDVANAILDGADACMLSQETAVGEHPVTVIKMMNRIMLATEKMLCDDLSQMHRPEEIGLVHPVTQAVVSGATRTADLLNAKLMVMATRTGGTALTKAKIRDCIPTIGVSDSKAALRRMCLYWGIIPIEGAPVHNGIQLRRFIDKWGADFGLLKPNDRVIFVTGGGIMQSAEYIVVVHKVEAPEGTGTSE